MSSRDDEELAVLLADLEETLTELQSAIEDDVRPRRRPPTPGEILRFTEEYTLPTVIALLEATVQSLELLRAVLRLAGPRPTEDRLRERLTSRSAPETAALRDALTDLRDALTGADLPKDSAAGSILSDARELTDEIDDRLDEASADRGRAERTDTSGVAIEVEEEDAVDVDAELTSLKESMEEEDESAE
ncbi:DUF7547 family protein [Haloplanus aerogenes]|uniref:Uncharacterized protein n=1 Tax=Haloplanus aerogenes TaxID=660522 RepID=A0A3M0DUJ1_9EURY|nr:hypothetical protein [Haloplanus aerogenes]AZH25257.1 hypothetical protein DU502_07630 [Haloplanus aerogenes]RMB24947.1 hypothetical protein ATH50_0027 [Haloplanus aerogenes]